MGQQEVQQIEPGKGYTDSLSDQPLIHPNQIATPLAILSMDDGVVILANDAFKSIVKTAHVGKSIKGLLNTPDKRELVNKTLVRNGVYAWEFEVPQHTMRFIVTKGSYANIDHYFVCIEKVDSIEKIACIGRSSFIKQAARVISNKEKRNVCLCAIDIDRFKVVNEKYGFKAGTYVLNELIRVIENNVDVKHLIGRLGDNEFGLLLQNTTIDDGLQLCEVIREQVKAEKILWQGEEISITVSIGIIAIDDETVDIEEVLAQSTLALDSARENGRDCVHSTATQDTMMAYHSGKMQYAMIIEDALQNDKFELFAQPIVSLDRPDSRHSYEVLLRIYDHNKQEFVSSQELITAAESLEVTTRIDRWVCEKVFKMLRDKASQQVRIPNISINLSGHSIVSVAFEKFLLELTEEYKVPTNCICFEITESVAVKSISRAQNFIRNLKAVGYKFSLDDFGVGYCSFNYLNQLDVDNVKIDGSFVSAMLDDATQFATVQAITNVARTMNIKTIAEFVEKPEIIKALKVIGVDYGQGYIFGKPSAMQEIF